MVRILILVHHDVAPAVLVIFQHLRKLLKQPNRQANDVVEIHSIRSDELGLIRLIDLCDLLLPIIRPHRHAVAIRKDHAVLCPADLPQHRLGLEELVVDGKLRHSVLDHPQAVVGVIDGEAAGVPQPLDLPPQNPHAAGVEGGSRHVPCFLPQHGLQPAFQLVGGFIGKGDGQNVPRTHRPVGDQRGQLLVRHFRPCQIPLKDA